MKYLIGCIKIKRSINYLKNEYICCTANGLCLDVYIGFVSLGFEHSKNPEKNKLFNFNLLEKLVFVKNSVLLILWLIYISSRLDLIDTRIEESKWFVNSYLIRYLIFGDLSKICCTISKILKTFFRPRYW